MNPLHVLNLAFLLGTASQVVHVPVLAAAKRRSAGLWLLVTLLWLSGAAWLGLMAMLLSPDDFWVAGAVGMLPTWVLALTPEREGRPQRRRRGLYVSRGRNWRRNGRTAR